MRITNNMISRGMLSNIHAHMRRMEALHHQLSSGKRLRVPSDDPAATAKSMRLHSDLNHTVQHRSNISSALSWLNATDAALGEVTDSFQRAYELAIYGGTDSHPQEALDAMAAEIDEILHHLVDLANTTHGNLYLFSGTETLTKPYDLDSTLPIGKNGNDPVYAGNYDDRRYETAPGVTVGVNLPGGNVFDEMFSVMIRLRDALEAGQTDQIGGPILDDMQASLDSLLEGRADLGARANRLELAADRMHQLELNIEQLLSDTEDVDIARALTDLKVTENVYRSALASGARIIQPTLLDFLR